MYTIDASVLVRDIDPTETEYEDCHALLEHIDATSTRVIVPLLALVEVAGMVSRTRRDPIRARLFVSALKALPHFTFVALDEALAQRASDIAADYRLRGAD